MEAVDIYKKENAKLKIINEGLKKQLKRSEPSDEQLKKENTKLKKENKRLDEINGQYYESGLEFVDTFKKLRAEIKKLKREIKNPENYKKGFAAAIKKVLAKKKRKSGALTVGDIEKIKP